MFSNLGMGQMVKEKCPENAICPAVFMYYAKYILIH
tara:strand:- start:230 stop:337 length:108 start_codon:yes stop_codon:yes gene_type:complete